MSYYLNESINYMYCWYINLVWNRIYCGWPMPFSLSFLCVTSLGISRPLRWDMLILLSLPSSYRPSSIRNRCTPSMFKTSLLFFWLSWTLRTWELGLLSNPCCFFRVIMSIITSIIMEGGLWMLQLYSWFWYANIPY